LEFLCLHLYFLYPCKSWKSQAQRVKISIWTCL